MAKCKNCSNLKKQIDWMSGIRYPWCYEINDRPDIETERECSKYCGKTNGDKIRRMTDEELALFLCKVKADYQWVDQEYPNEENGGEWEEWLQKEVE